MAGGGGVEPAPGGRILPVAELALPGPPQRRATRSPRSPSASCPVSRRTRSAAPPLPSTGVEHRLEPVAVDRWRPLRQRFAGHAAGRGHRGAPQRSTVRSCSSPGAATRASICRASAAVVARAGDRGGADRGERARLGATLRRPWPRERRACRQPRGGRGARGRARARGAGAAPPAQGPATVLLSPAAASFDMFGTTPPADGRSRRRSPSSRRSEEGSR